VKRTVIIVPAAAAVLIIVTFLAAGNYQPPLLETSKRSPLNTAIDFFGFGWHYSRHVWLRKAQRWKESNRERLLAFWYRPDYSGFGDIRELSLYKLGRWYQRRRLPARAARILIEACRRDPGNRWLIRQSSDMIKEMEQDEQLREFKALFPNNDSPSAAAGRRTADNEE